MENAISNCLRNDFIDISKGIDIVLVVLGHLVCARDIQGKLKRLFVGTIEQMLEAEMDEHHGYE